MASYQNIANQFSKQGLSGNREVTENQVKRALDNITRYNTGGNEFDYQVAHQIWIQTQDRNAGQPVKLSDYITTMVQAQNILREQVNQTQSKIRRQYNESNKQELMNDLFSFTQDHRVLTEPFGLEQIRDSKEINESKNMARSGLLHAESKLFTQDVDEREKSTDLLITFVLTLGLIGLQLILMFHKHHFFTLLCLFMVICSFILNYFEKKYVVVLMSSLGISILLDLVWMIAQAGEYWNPSVQSQHGRIQVGFLRFIVFMVVIEMAAKAILIGLLFKYRAVGQHVKKKVQIFGLTFHLDGQVDPHNLILKTMKKQSDGTTRPFDNM